MGIKTVLHLPYSLDLSPCDFWLFPKLRGCRSLWDNWGDKKSCNEGHWHTHTRWVPWGLPEVVGTVQQVHCSWRIFLRRGQEYHVCTMNKSTHTKKSLETYLTILVLLTDGMVMSIGKCFCLLFSFSFSFSFFLSFFIFFFFLFTSFRVPMITGITYQNLLGNHFSLISIFMSKDSFNDCLLVYILLLWNIFSF